AGARALTRIDLVAQPTEIGNVDPTQLALEALVAMKTAPDAFPRSIAVGIGEHLAPAFGASADREVSAFEEHTSRGAHPSHLAHIAPSRGSPSPMPSSSPRTRSTCVASQ